MDAMPDTIVRYARTTFVHPSAIVARGAEIGDGVRIGPFCSVGANVVIEDRAELISHVVVDGHTRLARTSCFIPSAQWGSRRRT